MLLAVMLVSLVLSLASCGKKITLSGTYAYVEKKGSIDSEDGDREIEVVYALTFTETTVTYTINGMPQMKWNGEYEAKGKKLKLPYGKNAGETVYVTYDVEYGDDYIILSDKKYEKVS